MQIWVFFHTHNIPSIYNISSHIQHYYTFLIGPTFELVVLEFEIMIVYHKLYSIVLTQLADCQFPTTLHYTTLLTAEINEMFLSLF